MQKDDLRDGCEIGTAKKSGGRIRGQVESGASPLRFDKLLCYRSLQSTDCFSNNMQDIPAQEESENLVERTGDAFVYKVRDIRSQIIKISATLPIFACQNHLEPNVVGNAVR